MQIFWQSPYLLLVQFDFSSCNFLSIFQFPDVVEFSEEMAGLGKTVIVAALDGTFQRQVLLIIFKCAAII